MLSVQPLLHIIHVLTQPAWLSAHLLAKSGSASKERPSAIISAEPLVSTASAASGVTIRPTTDTGIETISLIFLE